MTKVTIDRALIEQAISTIELAQENLRLHGDNCFLHDDGEYNSCFCGLDSLTQHLLTVIETLAMSLAEPAVEPVADGESYDELFNALHRIDSAAHRLPTFEVKHQGGLSAFVQNIIDAIHSAATPSTCARKRG